jgi:sugar lactone lactonase YvrE
MRARIVAAAVATLLVGAASVVGPPQPAAAAVGDVTTFPVTSLNGVGLAAQSPSSGEVWFRTRQASGNALAIARMNPATGAVTVAVVNGGPLGRYTRPVVGSDGNLWVGHSGDANRDFMRITPAGAVTTFDEALGGGSPNSITAGPDGALWWTNSISGVNDYFIRRQSVPPSGSPTAFDSEVIQPRSITTGPDGNLWYLGFDTVARMTPAGVVTLFDMPSGTGVGLSLVVGPDGNLWWCDLSQNRVVRTDPSTGEHTVFEPDGVLDDPVSIAAGDDGNLWLTSGTDDLVGRVTTDGVFTAFPHPEIHDPLEVARGPGGHLWISGEAANGQDVIHRLTVLSAPTAPTGVGAVPGNGQVVVSWSPPAEPGGTITSYRVFRNGVQVHQTANGSTTSHTVAGLTNGQASTFTVAAVNASGQGATSAGVVATPLAAPGAPSLTAAAPGNGQVALTWSAPASTGGGPITAYRVFDDGVQVHETANGSTLGHTVTGLTNGQASTFTVRAVNGGGQGPASNGLAATPRTVPGAPTPVEAFAGDGAVQLVWGFPASDGGSPITAYRVFRNGVQVHQTGSGAVSGHTVTGLTNGVAGTFTVRAVNAAGEGPASAGLVATPVGAPPPPNLTAATPGNGQVALTWTAHVSDGGSPITSYRVFDDGVQVHQTADGVTLSHTVAGLTNGEASTFTVRAVSALGESVDSNQRSATPSALPPAPTFTDVSSSHPFFDEIEWMAAEGISTGFQPGPTYKPGAAVSRQAMSAFMYRLAGSPSFTPGAPTFGDVATSHPFFEEIEWMASEGITTGTAASPKPLYKPSAAVSRSAMSAFMYRLAGEPSFTAPTSTTFGDVSVSHPFFEEIEWMASEGITTGTAASPKPLYKPASAVSRGAMSAFMQRLADGPGVGI